MTISIEQIEQLASERLAATSEDEEQWSFLFGTKGHQTFYYYTESDLDGWEFDPQEVDPEMLRWSRDRFSQLEKGLVEPTEAEVAEWRKVRAMSWLKAFSEDASIGYMVPIVVDELSVGYAVFDCGVVGEGAFTDPSLVSGHHSIERARQAALGMGAVVSLEW